MKDKERRENQSQQPDQQHSDAANQSGVVLNAADEKNTQQPRTQEEIYHNARDKGAGGVVFPDDDPDTASTPDVKGYADDQLNLDELNDSFQRHFSAQLAHHGRKIRYFMPAYRFGAMVRISDEYPSEQIAQVEDELRDLWEAENPDRWDEFEEAIRIGWLTAHQMLNEVEIDNDLFKAAARGEVVTSSQAESEIDPEDTEALEPDHS